MPKRNKPSLYDEFESDKPKNRSELGLMISAADFQRYQMAEVANKHDVAEMAELLTKCIREQKKVCVVLLLDRQKNTHE